VAARYVACASCFGDTHSRTHRFPSLRYSSIQAAAARNVKEILTKEIPLSSSTYGSFVDQKAPTSVEENTRVRRR
jgi:hypothetical protein